MNSYTCKEDVILLPTADSRISAKRLEVQLAPSKNDPTTILQKEKKISGMFSIRVGG